LHGSVALWSPPPGQGIASTNLSNRLIYLQNRVAEPSSGKEKGEGAYDVVAGIWNQVKGRVESMLRIIQQMSSGAAKSYYSTADYFSQGQELQGQWLGKGAKALGLEGVIAQKQWDALCDNLHPQTGEQLTARRNQERRIGWDFNFSVPKSVSLLYALTQDPRILEAFTDAVDQTMQEIESELHTRVRTQGQNTDRLTGNGVWGRFVHFTSRPVDGIPDPQLHAHNFLFNSTFDDKEFRWKAAQIGAIKRDANYHSARMHSRLAARLMELGIPIERTAKSWQICGLDSATEKKFSRRSRQIDAEAELRGITNPDEKARLGAITRDGKNKKLTMDQLRATWLSWLTPDESDVIQQIGQGIGKGEPPAPSPQRAREGIEHAAQHHFERESVVAERKLLATALHHSIGAATPELVHTALQDAKMITGEENGQRLITSPEVLAEERRMIQFAREGRGSLDPLVPDAIDLSPARFNAGQTQALAHLCNSRDRVMLLRGVAGAGKTTLLTELKKQVEGSGKRLIAFAPSADASRGVLREAGFDDAETVAMLLSNPKVQEQIRNQVLLIDESGQLGTPAMSKIFELADKMNARIILSGDRHQHGSIERGAAIRLLEEEAGLRSAALTEIVRQKERYKQAVAYLSQGRIPAGFKALEDLKWVHEVEDPVTRYERIAAEYVQATEAGKSVLVVSPTHSESAKVTSAIRSALAEEGTIGKTAVPTLKLTNRNLTLAERLDGVNYNDGDIIQFTQNATGYRKGARLTVGIDPIPLHLAGRFSVFRSSQLEVAKGDLIRITANGSTADGHRVNNGQIYGIKRIGPDGTLVLNNGWHLGPAFGQIDHGYCSTSFASQGKTKDKVIIAESSESFAAASRQQFYVSVSRGRSDCSIYTDDKDGLLKAVSGMGERMSATELAANARVLQRMQRAAIDKTFNPTPAIQRDAAANER